MVMIWVPTERDEVLMLALPLDKSAWSRSDPSDLKYTVPVGSVPELGKPTVTVAVKVTESPDVEGFNDETTAVEELPLVTVNGAFPLLPR